MSIDQYLFYDEDLDLSDDEVPDFTPISPLNLIDLMSRHLLEIDEVFSHKGWAHVLRIDQYGVSAEMWPHDTGEHYIWDGDVNDNFWN
jgi:hypothetical protein